MGWFSTNREQERFYLLPGMGGRNLRRKQRVFLQWAIAAGLATSAVFAFAIWMANGYR